MYDCVVIGGGPAGITAALHLARLRRTVLVIEDGASRARWIPRTHNHPGFPTGIGGKQLLARLVEQLAAYDCDRIEGRVASATLEGDVLAIATPSGRHEGRYLVLATGVLDEWPECPGAREAVAAERIRQCPICDAFELVGEQVIVLGWSNSSAGEALFLRHFTPHVTLATLGRTPEVSPETLRLLREKGITIVTSALSALEVRPGEQVAAMLADGTSLVAKSMYSALGVRARTEIAVSLGVALAPDGRITVDPHQRTSLAHVYAAGDVVTGLNQIGVAMAQGEIAAVAIHNSMREAEGMTVR